MENKFTMHAKRNTLRDFFYKQVVVYAPIAADV